MWFMYGIFCESLLKICTLLFFLYFLNYKNRNHSKKIICPKTLNIFLDISYLNFFFFYLLIFNYKIIPHSKKIWFLLIWVVFMFFNKFDHKFYNGKIFYSTNFHSLSVLSKISNLFLISCNRPKIDLSCPDFAFLRFFKIVLNFSNSQLFSLKHSYFLYFVLSTGSDLIPDTHFTDLSLQSITKLSILWRFG